MLELLFEPNPTTFIIWVVSFVLLGLSILVYVGSKQYESKVFALMCFCTAIWSFLVGNQVATPQQVLTDSTTSFVYEMLSKGGEHAVGFAIVLLIFYFCLVSSDKKKHVGARNVLLGLWILITPLSFTNAFIADVSLWSWGGRDVFGGNVWQWVPGIHNFIYNSLFIIFPIAGVAFLYIKKEETKDEQKRKQLTFTILTFLIGLPLPALGSIILPIYYGVYTLHWLGPVTHVVWIAVISYSIMKYNNMNVKVVLSELLILAGALLLLLNVFL